jgi:hypothetical protein
MRPGDTYENKAGPEKELDRKWAKSWLGLCLFLRAPQNEGMAIVLFTTLSSCSHREMPFQQVIDTVWHVLREKDQPSAIRLISDHNARK